MTVVGANAKRLAAVVLAVALAAALAVAIGGASWGRRGRPRRSQAAR